MTDQTSKSVEEKNASPHLRHGGVALPVLLRFVCTRDIHDLDSNVGEDQIAVDCEAYHDYFYQDATMGVICIPESRDDIFINITRQIVRMVDEQEYGTYGHLLRSEFLDHDLLYVSLALDWAAEPTRLTPFGNGVVVDVDMLRNLPDGKSFSEALKEEEEPAVPEPPHLTGRWVSVPEDTELLNKKRDVEIDRALDALSVRGWNGNLVAICLINKRRGGNEKTKEES